MNVGSAGVSPATPEARIDHHQTTSSVRAESDEARIYRGSQVTQTTLLGFIKYLLVVDGGLTTQLPENLAVRQASYIAKPEHAATVLRGDSHEYNRQTT